jgi:hypothetical protein
MKTGEFPFCNTPWAISIPKFENPFQWIPEIKDFAAVIFKMLKLQIKQMIVRLIVQMMQKICALISSAACKGLGAVGGAITGEGETNGPGAFRDAIKGAICGDDADDEQVDNTIADLFKSLGLGAAALANQERVDSFMSDLSSSVTNKELMSAFVGDPSSELLQIVDRLIEYEYTEFREGMPNQNAAADFFGNIGNLFPADLKDAIRDQLDSPGDEDLLPANPSLCATPEQIEDFCERRQALLAGRATPAQIAQMCENTRDQAKNDLEDLMA